MLDNHIYNLMEQITVESKSLWRIEQKYKKDTAGCEACLAFWNELEKDKEDHIKEITELIKTQIV